MQRIITTILLIAACMNVHGQNNHRRIKDWDYVKTTAPFNYYLKGKSRLYVDTYDVKIIHNKQLTEDTLLQRVQIVTIKDSFVFNKAHTDSIVRAVYLKDVAYIKKYVNKDNATVVPVFPSDYEIDELDIYDDAHSSNRANSILPYINFLTPATTYAMTTYHSYNYRGGLKYKSTTDTNLHNKKHLIRKEYLLDIQNKKNHPYIGLGYTPSFAYRGLQINSSQYTAMNDYESRRQKERSIYGHVINVQLGYTIKATHTFYAEYIQLSQGFASDSLSSNLKTGLPDNTKLDATYKYKRAGIGIGYNYSGYKHIINPTFELGMYYSFLKPPCKNADSSIYSYNDNQNDYKTREQARKAGLRPDVFGIKLAAGMGIRLHYRLELKLMPSLHYNLTGMNNGDLKSRLYNIGLTTNFSFRL